MFTDLEATCNREINNKDLLTYYKDRYRKNSKRIDEYRTEYGLD